MKYFIIAGEASGDLHGSNLMDGIINVDPNAEFKFFGGDLMQAKGGELIKHYREMAFMGYTEVIRNIRTISKNFKTCKSEIEKYNPDVVILIDYPSFNLKIAKFVKSLNIKVYYYISPKIWAWKEYRIKEIKKYIDKMFVIFPFEVDFYKKHELYVDYEGNPLMDSINEKIKDKPLRNDFILNNKLNDKPIIVLMPGSRKQEINRIFPIMLEAVKKINDYQIVVAGTNAIDKSLYDKFLLEEKVKIVYDQTYELLMNSEIAVVTSGTAALETALFNVPQVVCYVTSKLTYNIVKAFYKLKYVTLVNLILDKLVIKELLQNDLTPDNLLNELDMIINNVEYRDNMLKDYSKLQKSLGEPGSSHRIASKIYNYLNN